MGKHSNLVVQVVKPFRDTTDWVPQKASLRWKLTCRVFIRKFLGQYLMKERRGSVIGQRAKLSSITVPTELLLANTESWNNSLDLKLGGVSAPLVISV